MMVGARKKAKYRRVLRLHIGCVARSFCGQERGELEILDLIQQRKYIEAKGVRRASRVIRKVARQKRRAAKA